MGPSGLCQDSEPAQAQRHPGRDHQPGAWAATALSLKTFMLPFLSVVPSGSEPPASGWPLAACSQVAVPQGRGFVVSAFSSVHTGRLLGTVQGQTVKTQADGVPFSENSRYPSTVCQPWAARGLQDHHVLKAQRSARCPIGCWRLAGHPKPIFTLTYKPSWSWSSHVFCVL